MTEDRSAAGDVDEVADEAQASTVRPYTVTAGRTRAKGLPFALEALVQALTVPDVSMPPEQRRLLELTTDQYQSVAELSAHLHLPVVTIRVLVDDMSADGKVLVHPPAPASGNDPTAALRVLESVLDGISSL